MNENKKKVVIVDDHPLFRERLAQLINYEPDMEVTGEAESSKDAIQLIRKTSPDLATVDITLKGSSGLELIKSIKPISIGLRVLVLTMHEESLYAERALRAGASGYITKHQAADEVLLAIRRVLAGEVYLSEKMTSGFLKSLTNTEVKTIPGSVDRLTDRELEVLNLIGRGHTAREIANRLQVGIATIDTYRVKIKEKMNLRNAPSCSTSPSGGSMSASKISDPAGHSRPI
jgi:DNA-binding NarL/FixJ family response regulator